MSEADRQSPPTPAVSQPLLLLAIAMTSGTCALAALIPTGFWLDRLMADASKSAVLEQGVEWSRIGLLVLAAMLAGTAFILRRHPDPADRRPAARGGLALGLILLAATALRIAHLDGGLWFDEIVTLVEYVRLPAPAIVTTYTFTNNHVLYSLLAHATVAIFGESAWALRLPAAVFGVASVWALFALGREVSSRREALLTSALMAFSYHHVWFSQNARGYTGILFFSLWGTALFLRALRTGSHSSWLGYGAILALAMYTHLSAVFVFAAHGLIYAAREALSALRAPRSEHQWNLWPLLGFAIGAALVTQLYLVLLPQLFETFAAQSTAAPSSGSVEEWKNPLWMAIEIARGLPLGSAAVGVAVLGALVAAVGFASYARRDPWLAAVFSLPTVLCMAGLLALHFNLWPRYFLVSIGFACLVAVRGVFASTEWVLALGRRDPARAGGASTVATAVACMAIALSAASVFQNYRFPKQDYPAARDFVEAARHPSEPVLTVGLAAYAYSAYYAPSLPGWLAIETPAEIDAQLADHSRAWLLYTFPLHLRGMHNGLYQRIERDFEIIRTFPGTLGDGAVHVMRRSKPSAERGT